MLVNPFLIINLHIRQFEFCLHYIRIFCSLGEFAVGYEHELTVFAYRTAVSAVGFAVVGFAEDYEFFSEFIRLIAVFGVSEKIVKSAYLCDPISARKVGAVEYVALYAGDDEAERYEKFARCFVVFGFMSVACERIGKFSEFGPRLSFVFGN